MTNKLKSAQVIPLSFLLVIFIGTFILMLPISTADGKGADFITALFTATTSVCVTGLVVVDTFAHWSLIGKIVILILIQLGGLGIISVTSILMLLINRRFTLRETLMLHDAFNLDSMSGVKRFLAKVFLGTFFVEGLGAILYMPVFIPQFGVARGIWYSVFTGVSAFCNAGIDIIGPNSLIDYNTNPLVLGNTTMLIVLGGLGYVVWFDMIHGVREGFRKKYSPAVVIKRFSEHTKLVFQLTAVLLLIGFVIVFIMEYNNPDTIGNMSLGNKLMNAFFQSVTFRTAGFAAVPQQNLTDGSCIIGALLMFIGGSPVGTAGGVKTVTFFLVIINTLSFIRNRNENVVFGRKITSDLIHKSAAIISVSFFITFIFMLLLVKTNELGLVDAMYETFSATATVGLSRAVTPTLNVAGRLIIIMAMYLGRIGPISMALFFSQGTSGRNKVSYAKGNFYVG